MMRRHSPAVYPAQRMKIPVVLFGISVHRRGPVRRRREMTVTVETGRNAQPPLAEAALKR
jgi:hypothetical protein